MKTQTLASALAICCIAGCIIRKSDFAVPLVGNYQLVRTSAHQVSIVPVGGWSEGTPIIPSKVVEVAFGDRYILAKRQHLKPRSNSGVEEPVDEFDYWILDTAAPALYGPLDEPAYADKRKELAVANSLQLRDADSLSPYRQ